MREKYGAREPESWRLRTHAQTAGVSLMAQQPENNITRGAYQALAAVLGGTQSLHTNALDETLALPTERAARLALRTQQLLAYETGVPNVIDPLAGSYYVERLTDTMEEEAERIFAEIDELGGVVRGIEEGYFQRQIAQSAAAFQREVEENRRVIVGVNAFTEGNEERRDAKTVERALGRLEDAVRAEQNLMEPMLDAVRAYATLGEMRQALERVYGRFREPIFF